MCSAAWDADASQAPVSSGGRRWRWIGRSHTLDRCRGLPGRQVPAAMQSPERREHLDVEVGRGVEFVASQSDP